MKRAKPQQMKVRCADCRYFQRDTSGSSRTLKGEYFMGLCPRLHADGVVKYMADGVPAGGRVFADKARTCKDYLEL